MNKVINFLLQKQTRQIVVILGLLGALIIYLPQAVHTSSAPPVLDNNIADTLDCTSTSVATTTYQSTGGSTIALSGLSLTSGNYYRFSFDLTSQGSNQISQVKMIFSDRLGNEKTINLAANSSVLQTYLYADKDYQNAQISFLSGSDNGIITDTNEIITVTNLSFDRLLISSADVLPQLAPLTTSTSARPSTINGITLPDNTTYSQLSPTQAYITFAPQSSDGWNKLLLSPSSAVSYNTTLQGLTINATNQASAILRFNLPYPSNEARLTFSQPCRLSLPVSVDYSTDNTHWQPLAQQTDARGQNFDNQITNLQASQTIYLRFSPEATTYQPDHDWLYFAFNNLELTALVTKP